MPCRVVYPRLLLWLVLLLTSFSSVLAWAKDEKPPTYLTASVGQYVVFNCHLDFPNDIEIPYILNWIKENRTLYSWFGRDLSTAEPDYAGRLLLVSQKIHITGLGRGSVNLTSIRESDAGWYECKIFFPNRTPSTRPNGTWYHLNVDGGTLLAIPPINTTTLEGEPAHLSCVTKDNETEVTWYKDNMPITDIPDLYTRSAVSPEGSLTILKTDMADPGQYGCVVTNANGDRQTASAYLNVHYKAKVVYTPREVYLPFGRPGILDCHFRANPPLTHLRWEKDGLLFDPYNVHGVYHRRNGSLFFSKVDEKHGGKYRCTPINELGTEGPSPPVLVIVQHPPVFTVTPHTMYYKKLGETLEMPCDAVDGEDNHRPTIVWLRKDGAPLPIGRMSLLNGNLTIEDVRETDRGHYQCIASNEAATISADTELSIENFLPRAPYNLSGISTPNSVTLRWNSGFNRPRTEYTIWYRLADIAEWRTTKTYPRGKNEATIGGLNPGSVYEFMILSREKDGEGMFSKPIRIKTKGNDPSTSTQESRTVLSPFQQIGPPRNLRVNQTDEGYLVTWQPPEFGRDELNLYIVRWSQGGGTLEGSAETKDTFYLVRDLDPDTTYYFQVVALTHNEYEATSVQLVVHLPGYRQLRAISLGLALAVICLLAAAAATWYLRKLHARSDIRNTTPEQDIPTSKAGQPVPDGLLLFGVPK